MDPSDYEDEKIDNDSLFPASYEEIKKEYDEKYKHREITSKKLGELLLLGWTLLGSQCPCCETPLMRLQQGALLCVACDDEFTLDDETEELVLIRSQSNAPEKVNVTKNISDTNKHVSSTNFSTEELENDDFYLKDAPMLAVRQKSNEDDASSLIAKHLIQGWALLDEVCSQSCCNGEVPLMKDKQGNKVCVGCYLTKKQNNIADKKEVGLIPLTKPLISSDAVFTSTCTDTDYSKALQVLDHKLNKAIDRLENINDTSCTMDTVNLVLLISKLAEAITAVRGL